MAPEQRPHRLKSLRLRLALALAAAVTCALEDESQWAIRNRLTGASDVPNFLDHSYFDGLKSARPEAVKILR